VVGLRNSTGVIHKQPSRSLALLLEMGGLAKIRRSPRSVILVTRDVHREEWIRPRLLPPIDGGNSLVGFLRFSEPAVPSWCSLL
jgi:hypothetical protein